MSFYDEVRARNAVIPEEYNLTVGQLQDFYSNEPERSATMTPIKEYTPCGLPVRQSTAKQYRLTERDKEYIKSFAADGVVSLDAYLYALEHLPDQH